MAQAELLADDWKVDLEVFEGPLDLLLYLIRREELNIYDIPIGRITEQYMAYLDLMTELCQEKGIKLVLIKSPSLYPHWYEEWDAQMVEYAKAHDLLYINMLDIAESEIGIDYNVDTYDGGLHMNVTGAEKCASYLGRILVDKYGIASARGDEDLEAYWAEVEKRYDEAKK